MNKPKRRSNTFIVRRNILPYLLTLMISFFGGISEVNAQKEMAANTSTEQPGFYVGTYTMYPGNFQMESNLTFSQFRNSVFRVSTLNVPAVLLRYGVSDWLEVRAGTEYNRLYETALGIDIPHDPSVSPLLLGVKAQVVQPGERLPEISLRAHFRIPKTGSSGAGPERLASNIMAISNFPILSDFTGYINLGIDWTGESTSPTYQYGFALERVLVSDLTGYLEAYGFISGDSGPIDHRYDLGFFYPITPKLQADLSGGIGIWDDNHTWFTSLGVSFRVVPLRNSSK